MSPTAPSGARVRCRAAPPPPEPTCLDALDASAYPHLLDLVFTLAPFSSLLSLRAASSALRDRADRILSKHVLIFADGRLASRLAPRSRLPLLPSALPSAPLTAPSSTSTCPSSTSTTTWRSRARSSLRALNPDPPSTTPHPSTHVPATTERIPTVTLAHAPARYTPSIVDIQAPHFDWAELRDVMHWDDTTCPCGSPMQMPAGWIGCPGAPPPRPVRPPLDPVPLPPHLAPLRGLDLNGITVRRWGPHECWVPRGSRALEHLGSAYTQRTSGTEWYIFSPGEVSRANLIRKAEREVLTLAGEGVRHILDAIRHPRALQAPGTEEGVGAGEVGDDEEGEGGEGGGGEETSDWDDSDDEEEEDTGLVDRCATVMADFWIAIPPESHHTWILVDVETWPSWADGKHAPLTVEAALRAGVRRRLGQAGWDGSQIEATEQKLRFASRDEYVADVGDDIVALEGDDHGFIFPP